MEILTQLGVDKTIWIQLGFFFLSYFFLSQFLFKPYARNLEFRKKNTTVAVEEANKIMTATEFLSMDYEGKMKTQNEQFLIAYNKIKNEGHEEEQKLLAAARLRAEGMIAEAGKKIEKEIKVAREQLQKQVPELSKLTAKKLLGRDL